MHEFMVRRKLVEDISDETDDSGSGIALWCETTRVCKEIVNDLITKAMLRVAHTQMMKEHFCFMIEDDE